ncbi:hypothetical protein NQ317_019907 [Molorchus minor]|uniref:Uncharacterized protein n=1 Tax=Molorchus minor TaxID=1323400 RepID=A0ABQ9K6Q1_9CUCU|nr:hypothetical protein NQ317_019907 [Molorchus minor]
MIMMITTQRLNSDNPKLKMMKKNVKKKTCTATGNQEYKQCLVSKFSGASAMQVKNRPRIPTPDVTKEVIDRENRLAASVTHVQNQMSTGLTLMSHQLPANYHSYPTGNVPVVQVVLSPIQELDSTGSVNNTLHANQPGTAALAQAVLSPGIGPVLATTPVSVPMTVSQLTSLGFSSHQNSPLLARTFEHHSSRNPTLIQASRNVSIVLWHLAIMLMLVQKAVVGAFDHPSIRNPTIMQVFESEKPPTMPLTLTEVHPEDEQPLSSRSSNGSAASEISHASKDSIVSNMSNTTASLTSKRSLEVPSDPTDGDAVAPSAPESLSTAATDAGSEAAPTASVTPTPRLERKPSFMSPSVEMTPSLQHQALLRPTRWYRWIA